MESLSQSESQVYDRQLRVWGIEVQKRLQEARALIIGTGGLAAEVSKNIVLAGIGSVTLVDDLPCKEREDGCFLVPSSAHDEASIASASVATLSEMNPLVSVAAQNLESLSAADHLQGFDVVVLIGGTFAEQFRINSWCRAQNVNFYAASVSGYHGHIFADLGTHVYHPKGAEIETEGRGFSVQYVHLKEALMTTEIPPKSHGLYFTLQACATFEERFGYQPGAHDGKKLMEVAGSLLHDRKWNGKSLDEDMIRHYIDAIRALPAVCAIIGGMLSNEIIKSVGASSEPLRNFFFYSIKDGKGMVEYFGP